MWEVDFPGGIDNSNIKWRAFIWILSEALLVVSIAVNYLPGVCASRRKAPRNETRDMTFGCTARWYSKIFKFTIGIIMLDFLLTLIWLPIGVSKTYGFRSAKDVFTMTCA